MNALNKNFGAGAFPPIGPGKANHTKDILGNATQDREESKGLDTQVPGVTGAVRAVAGFDVVALVKASSESKYDEAMKAFDRDLQKLKGLDRTAKSPEDFKTPIAEMDFDFRADNVKTLDGSLQTTDNGFALEVHNDGFQMFAGVHGKTASNYQVNSENGTITVHNESAGAHYYDSLKGKLEVAKGYQESYVLDTNQGTIADYSKVTINSDPRHVMLNSPYGRDCRGYLNENLNYYNHPVG